MARLGSTNQAPSRPQQSHPSPAHDLLRVQDQMWLVHSLSAQTDLKPDDLRRQLIEYLEDPSHLVRALEEKNKRTESVFERDVLKGLVRAGYRVTPQWRVGAYRIDLVIEANEKRMAVECDGDRYHPLDNLGQDMERQAVLERMGWVLSRIRGSEFFRDADRAMAPVFAKLESLDIVPVGESANYVPCPPNELTDRVIRRAEELRVSWLPSDPYQTAS
jgi:very-short-patch-repair endonuclease